MSKKDYELIAQSLKSDMEILIPQISPNADYLFISRCQLTTTVLNLADSLQRDNPKFDRARFLKACGQ